MNDQIRCTLGIIVIGLPLIALVLFYQFVEESSTTSKLVAFRSFRKRLFIYLLILAGLILLVLLGDLGRALFYIPFLLFFGIWGIRYYRDLNSSVCRLYAFRGTDSSMIALILVGSYALLMSWQVFNEYIESGFRVPKLLAFATMLSTSVWIIGLAVRKNIITEKGIILTWWMINWMDIQSYRWFGYDDNKLEINTNYRIEYFRQILLDIRPKDKEKLSQLLAAKMTHITP